MINPTEILPDFIFYSYYSEQRKEKVAFMEHNTLVLQVSGQFTIETTSEKVSMEKEEMLLVRKNQLATLTKSPLNDSGYQTIIIRLQNDLLRQIALEEKIVVDRKYIGKNNIHIPANEFLRGFFQSIKPYISRPDEPVTKSVGLLKVKEAVQLLLHIKPELRNFLFDFSEPHKMDLEKFMLNNFQFNIPIEKFARLTGRSLASFKRDFQKIFSMAPRQWLQDKRLLEARHLIEHKQSKPSAIYLDLGFESLSHFSSSFKKKFGKAPTGVRGDG